MYLLPYHTHMADTKILWRTFSSDCSVFVKYRMFPSVQKWWASVARSCESCMCMAPLFPCRSGLHYLISWKIYCTSILVYLREVSSNNNRLVIQPSSSIKGMAPFSWRRPSASREMSTAPRRSSSSLEWAPDTTIES